MAEDFPADKYGFRASPEVRSFGEVIVHAMTSARVGSGRQMDELSNEFAAEGVHALHAKEERAMVIGRKITRARD